MSALRVSVPGQPVRFVDLGPDSPQKAKGAVIGGVLIVAESTRTRDLRLQREAMARYNAAKEASDRYYATHRTEILERRRKRRLCGRWVILSRSECGQKRGHAGECS